MADVIPFKTKGQIAEDKLPPLTFEACHPSGIEDNMVRVFFNREPTEYELEAIAQILNDSEFGPDTDPKVIC